MKLKIFLVLSFLSISFLGSAQRFSIQPGILNFSVEPGKTQSEVVRITNSSSQKISFQAYLADWLRDSTGGHNYFRPDTLGRSCAGWITINKNFIEVEPRQTEELVVVLHGPFNAAAFTKMRWAMLFLQSVQEKDSAAAKSKEIKTEIKEVMRVGIHIYQIPPAITKVSAQAVSLMPVKDSANSYNFSVVNSGELMLQCKAYLTLTNIQNAQEYKLDKVEFPIFPEGKRVVKFDIPAEIPKGKYSALAVLDIGEEETLQAIEKNIEIK